MRWLLACAMLVVVGCSQDDFVAPPGGQGKPQVDLAQPIYPRDLSGIVFEDGGPDAAMPDLSSADQ